MARAASRKSSPSSALGAVTLGLVLLLPLPALAISLSSWAAHGAALLGVIAVINGFCFLSYWTDKRSAEARGWRVPEITLHGLELVGGWPAAFVAQRLLRHKTAKLGYQFVFWTIVAMYQLVALDALLGWPI
ncbi:MAG TPA: DUF1294 domain-containing protein [Candidatus Didemnitutus sp.]|nr:DUF1294 domain-containing protein [Candidatus Didemnitutus sp.]